jgi:hypothetical protein
VSANALPLTESVHAVVGANAELVSVVRVVTMLDRGDLAVEEGFAVTGDAYS